MIKTYDDIVEAIILSKPFAFSRWGDGEWLNIRKAPGGNCDGNLYYHDLGDALQQIVEVKQDYILGAQDNNGTFQQMLINILSKIGLMLIYFIKLVWRIESSY